MRRLTLLSLTSLVSVALISQRTPAQVAESYEAGGDIFATTNETLAATAVPSLLRRTGGLVAMAQDAPAAAPTVRAARQATRFASAASAAYQAALASYQDADYQAADSAANVAMRMAELATEVGTLRGGAVVTESAASLGNPPGTVVLLVPNPAPAVMITETATMLPPSYAGLTPRPFGAYASGPYAPPLRDSLPFGATPVGRTPALVAP
jgi:hypothetical protein